MKTTPTTLPGVQIVEPDVFADDRGFFMEAWNARRYEEHGLPGCFVQDNVSYSRRGVLRGLHFQNPSAQGKLVSVLRGEIYDVAVDIRLGSPTFGCWIGLTLSAANRRQLYIPEGFAHGFVVINEDALVSYKCTAFYDKGADAGIRWDDPDVGVEWPVQCPLLTPKDADAPLLRDVPEERLFRYDAESRKFERHGRHRSSLIAER